MYGHLVKKIGASRKIFAPSLITASGFNTLNYGAVTPFVTAATAVNATSLSPSECRVNAFYYSGGISEIKRVVVSFDLTGINKNATFVSFAWERISGTPYDFAVHSTTAVIPAVLSDYSNKTALIGIDNTTVSLNTIVDFNAAGISYFNSKKGGVMYVLIEDKQYDYNLVAPATGTGNLNTASLSQLKLNIIY